LAPIRNVDNECATFPSQVVADLDNVLQWFLQRSLQLHATIFSNFMQRLATLVASSCNVLQRSPQLCATPRNAFRDFKQRYATILRLHAISCNAFRNTSQPFCNAFCNALQRFCNVSPTLFALFATHCNTFCDALQRSKQRFCLVSATRFAISRNAPQRLCDASQHFLQLLATVLQHYSQRSATF
jgi:hypothetical protein